MYLRRMCGLLLLMGCPEYVSLIHLCIVLLLSAVSLFISCLDDLELSSGFTRKPRLVDLL